MVCRHTVSIGHALLNLGDIFIGEHKILGHDLCKIQDVCNYTVDLIDRKSLWVIPRHCSINVVPQGRYGCHLHHGGPLGEIKPRQVRNPPGLNIFLGRSAHDWREDLSALTEHAMTRRTLRLPDILTLSDRPRTCGKSNKIWTHIDIPGLDFGWGCGAANAG